MKKRYISFVILLIMFISFLYTTNIFIKTNGLKEYYYTIIDTILYNTSDITSDMIDIIPSHTQLNVIEITADNNWYLINYNNKTGYILKEHVISVNKEYMDEALELSISEKSMELQILQLINNHRKTLGLHPYEIDNRLNVVAKIRAMEIYNKWSHERPCGKRFGSTFKDNKIEYNYIGENLAKWFTTPEMVFEAWMQSAGHKASIEDPYFTKTGIYVYKGPDGKFYVAQEFMQ